MVKIVTFVPLAEAEAVRGAIAAAGGGRIGEYAACSFTTVGEGRFMPSAVANPYVGEPGRLEVVQEARIEFVCLRSDAKVIVSALKAAHPYEEVALDIFPLLSEDEL